jgi:phage I-like protein
MSTEIKEEIELVIENEEPKEEIVVVEDNKSEPSSPDDPSKALEELRSQLEKERREKIEAQRAAQEAQVNVQKAKSEVDDTNLQLLKSAIDSVKANSATLRSNYSAAMSVGDFEKAAEIQEAMANNAARLLQLENGKQAMESRPKEEPANSSDPIEYLAARVTPTSAEWLRRNRDNLSNQKKIQRMVRAHDDAVDDGIIPDTKEYFEFIENRLGINSSRSVQAEESALSEASKPAQRRQAPPAAPVSRQPTSPSGQRPNVVRLSAAEKEMASMMGMSEKEYALNKFNLQREGKL